MTLFTALLLAFQCLLRHPTIIGVGGWRAAAAVTRLGVAGPHPAPFTRCQGWDSRMRGNRGDAGIPWVLTTSPSTAGQGDCLSWEAQTAHLTRPGAVPVPGVGAVG